MKLYDALLNAKKYIREPKYFPHEKLWAVERHTNKGWQAYYFYSEESAWMEYYNQFRQIKQELLNDRSR